MRVTTKGHMTRKQGLRMIIVSITILVFCYFASFQVASSDETTSQDECVKCHTNANKLQDEARHIPRPKESTSISGAG